MESQERLRSPHFVSSSCLPIAPIDDQIDPIVRNGSPGPFDNSPGKCFKVEGAKDWLQRHIAPALVLIVLSSWQGRLLAQQALPPGQGWSQNDPYGGQYSPDQQSGYGQPQYTQPYSQQPGYVPPLPYGQGQSPSYPPQPYPDTNEPYQQPAYGAGQPPTQALNTEQLEQLVAPIALYPDTLVAQVLAAATYPAQVVDADHWRRAQGDVSPDQIAAEADAQNWDPSLKALTAFPQVLAEMEQNLRWTIALGNAYYNQPQDVLDVVQVMRQRAEAAGNLQSTPQEGMSYDQGYIQLAPVNPQVVYVPAYDPWTVYGQPVQPYRGFSLGGALGSFFGSSFGSGAIRYGLGIAMSAFSHTSFGWLGWGLDWLTHSLLFHNSAYYSHSTTVADWGLPHGGPRAFRPGAMAARSSGNNYRNQAPGNAGRVREYSRGYGASNPNNRGTGLSYVRPAERYGQSLPTQGYYRGNAASGTGYARPPMMAYNRVEPPVSRPQPNGGSNSGFGYGSGFRGTAGGGYGARPGPYNPPQQAYRAPMSDLQRGKFNERSPGAFGTRGLEGYSGKQGKSGGSHAFYGGHEPKHSSGGGKSSHGHSEK